MATRSPTLDCPSIAGSRPAPVHLPADRTIVALGGDLKSVISLMKADEVHSSDVFGDLADAGAYRRFVAAVEEFEAGAAGTHVTIAHDLHPGYLSTALAQKTRHARTPVQHHHAHIASCLADNGETGPVIGLACDGTGYGTDGAIWGCEVLTCDLETFDRVGHLGYFLLPGGDAAARETWRPALSLVRAAYGDDWPRQTAGLFAGVPAPDLATVELMLRRNVNSVPTSSLGRLFDAVAFLLDLCACNRTEAQAAVALERCAERGHAGRALPFEVVLPPEDEGSRILIDVSPAIRALVDGVLGKRHTPDLAADFHETVSTMLATTVEMVADRTGIYKAALSGGCFLNGRLNDGLTAQLQRRGMTVLRHQRVPVGDAGLSFGQAVIAAARGGAVPSRGCDSSRG
jgi:hydrogenase maturation protein HypF